eukprot:TRINITY_DN1926_c0_g1_i2.p3 TRINITY_DN1926_c0_g1~~TRINITY_DN1926_c0_g1_i2.p3  ORF type:complete len:113 (+),score=52.67 TRINITY_DN1926_c0_g1_i2:64-402(+)
MFIRDRTKIKILMALIPSSVMQETDIDLKEKLDNKEDRKDEEKDKGGRWSKEEHELFLEALQLFGKDWKKVQQHVGTRTTTQALSLIHISEPTRPLYISYAVFCLKKKNCYP